MVRRSKNYFLLPMMDDEFQLTIQSIYADRHPRRPLACLADEWGLDPINLLHWGGITPVPAEVACGLRARLATMNGDIAPPTATILSMITTNLVVQWVCDKASPAEVAKVFAALARRFSNENKVG